MNDSASLGDTIRDRRLALGYSLGQLATKVTKTASSIRAWERGDSVPSEEEAVELAAALDLDTALLVTLREPAKVWDSEEVEEVDVHDPWDEDDELPRTEPDEAAAIAAASAAEAEPELPDADAATVEEEPAEPVAGVEAEESQPDADESATEDPQPKQVPKPLPVGAVGGVGGAGGEATDVAPLEPKPDTDQLAEMFEAKTEAVPVVPATSVAVAQPQADPVLASASAQRVETRSDNPVIAAWDDLRALYYRIFDPRRRWIYRVRFVLLLIAFFIMLRVLAWAAGNLFDALGEVLDSVSFSPGETPDVEN